MVAVKTALKQVLTCYVICLYVIVSRQLFFVLDYCAGGELFFHLGKMGKFSEERSKVGTAICSSLALLLRQIFMLNLFWVDAADRKVLTLHLLFGAVVVKPPPFFL